MLLKRGTGSGERGTGNGSLGTSCQRKPPQKSKMAVPKNEREKEEDKERNSCLGWNQVRTKLQIRLTFHVYVLSRWYVFSIFNLFHLQYDKVLGLSFRDTWHTHITPGLITPFTLDRRLILPVCPPECSFSHSDKLLESKGFIQAHYMPCFENAW